MVSGNDKTHSMERVDFLSCNWTDDEQWQEALDALTMAAHENSLDDDDGWATVGRLRKALEPAFVQWMRDECVKRETPIPQLVTATEMVAALIVNTMALMVAQNELAGTGKGPFAGRPDALGERMLEHANGFLAEMAPKSLEVCERKKQQLDERMSTEDAAQALLDLLDGLTNRRETTD